MNNKSDILNNNVLASSIYMPASCKQMNLIFRYVAIDLFGFSANNADLVLKFDIPVLI